MKTLHTPGPWEIEQQSKSARGYWVRKAPLDYIAMVCGRATHKDDANNEQETLANATAIVALPALLELFSHFRIINGELHWPYHEDESADDLFDKQTLETLLSLKLALGLNREQYVKPKKRR